MSINFTSHQAHVAYHTLCDTDGLSIDINGKQPPAKGYMVSLQDSINEELELITDLYGKELTPELVSKLKELESFLADYHSKLLYGSDLIDSLEDVVE